MVLFYLACIYVVVCYLLGVYLLRKLVTRRWPDWLTQKSIEPPAPLQN